MDRLRRLLCCCRGTRRFESSSEKGTDSVVITDAPERGKWGSKAEFVLSCLGYAVGLGNVWRFPWLCWKNGGGAFLIPYFIMLIFCGIPSFFMECSMGQYAASGPMSIWSCSPLFKGVGIGMLVITFMSSIYYNVIIAWSLFYMFASFQKNLPWENCQANWHTDKCFSRAEEKACEYFDNGSYSGSLYLYRKCFNGTQVAANHSLVAIKGNLTEADKISPAQEYFNMFMYQLNYFDESGDNAGTRRPMEDVGTVKWDLALILLLAWIICYLCVAKGIKTSGKVVYFTALFPYVVLVILLVRSLMLWDDGAKNGIYFYMYPNVTRLADPVTWADAAGQVFFSLSVGMGGLMTYASYNEFNNNVLRDTLIVTLAETATSVVAGFAVFAILGFMAQQVGAEVQDVVNSGSALAFVAYPEVVTLLPVSPLWSFLFFVMLLFLGLDSQFAGIEALLTCFCDSFPKLIKWKLLVSAGICAVLYILGLSMVTSAGVYWEELFNYYSAGWSLIFIGFCEVMVYAWVYGAENILKNLEEMLGYRFNLHTYRYWIVLWKFITPMILLAILVTNFVYNEDLSYGDYVLPRWAQVLGWLMAVCPVVIVPCVSVGVYARDKRQQPDTGESWHQRVRRLTRPSSDWLSSAEKDKRYKETREGLEAQRSLEGGDNQAYVGSAPEIKAPAGALASPPATPSASQHNPVYSADSLYQLESGL